MVDLALSLTIIRRHVGSSPGLGAYKYLSKLSMSDISIVVVFWVSTPGNSKNIVPTKKLKE
jgi:hypothetical protein